jgi:hypothetical protein
LVQEYAQNALAQKHRLCQMLIRSASSTSLFEEQGQPGWSFFYYTAAHHCLLSQRHAYLDLRAARRAFYPSRLLLHRPVWPCAELAELHAWLGLHRLGHCRRVVAAHPSVP